MFTETFYNQPGDCAWLREVHLKDFQAVPPFQAFTMRGNEDAPEQVDLYSAQNPRHDDVPFSIYF